MQQNPKSSVRSSSKNAVLVGSGMLLSRILGFVRGRIFAYYFGNLAAADAFNAAFKIPNFLQNLFGEGALSSSFIPVYASLLAADREEEANRVARVTGSLLAVVVSILVLVGTLAAPLLTYAIAPGFEGEKREFTVQMVRIIFPGTGVLVLSAWCLGILNSHRRFFLPYAAPVLWNLAMIGTLLGFGGKWQSYDLAKILAWGSVLGSFLQFGVQLPAVLRLTKRFQFQLEIASSNIRTIIRNFLPSLATRGANQVSSYVDSILASPLPTGAVAMLAYVQAIYLLPVSLFGMSISNAELPEMSSQTGSDETVAAVLCDRLNNAMRRVAFFIVPSVVCFLALGDSVIAFLYQTGKFTRDDVVYGWAVLAGSTVGLLASALGRLYTSAFWALRDTRTPFRFAVLRVALTAVLGWFLAFPVTVWLGIPRHLGLVGLTVSAGMAAWVEFTLLRSALRNRVGKTGLQPSYLARLWFIAISAAIPSFAEKLLLKGLPPLISGFLVLATFGIAFIAGAAAFRLPEALTLIRTVRSKFQSGQSL